MRCPHCGAEISTGRVVEVKEGKQGTSIGCIIGAVIGFFLLLFFGGMFAAIAYPQYVRAIEYSKFKEGLAIADQISVAETNYKKANGKYTNNFSNLKLSIPESSSNGSTLETKNFTYQLAMPNVQIIRKENSDFNYKITANLSKKQATCEGSDIICDRFKE